MFFRIVRNISFSENVFFQQKKAPAASRRAHKKVLSNINNTRTRTRQEQEEQEEQEEKEKNLKRKEKEKRRNKHKK